MREFLHYYSVVGIEEEGEVKLYLYNAKYDSLFPFPVDTGVDPDPDPDPDPDEPFIFDLAAYMINPKDGALSMVTERFEILEAQTDGDNMVFRIKTLQDKMSMQEGVFFFVPINLSIIPQTKVTGAVQISAPRRLDWDAVSGEAVWERSYAGYYGLVFVIKEKEMAGSGDTSDDDPWSWHYGFEIEGRIPLIQE